MCDRLKRVITTEKQEDNKSSNAAFFQILISFYIQSEVVIFSLRSSNFCLFCCSFIPP